MQITSSTKHLKNIVVLSTLILILPMAVQAEQQTPGPSDTTTANGGKQETVGSNHITVVGGSRAEAVDGTQSINIGGGSRTETVGTHNINIGGGSSGQTAAVGTQNVIFGDGANGVTLPVGTNNIVSGDGSSGHPGNFRGVGSQSGSQSTGSQTTGGGGTGKVSFNEVSVTKGSDSTSPSLLQPGASGGSGGATNGSGSPGTTNGNGSPGNGTYHSENFTGVGSQLGDQNVLNIGSQTGGAGAGKIQFNPFSITKKTDSASPLLFQQAASGGSSGTTNGDGSSGHGKFYSGNFHGEGNQIGSQTGGGTGKVRFNPFGVTKETDSSSPSLIQSAPSDSTGGGTTKVNDDTSDPMDLPLAGDREIEINKTGGGQNDMTGGTEHGSMSSAGNTVTMPVGNGKSNNTDGKVDLILPGAASKTVFQSQTGQGLQGAGAAAVFMPQTGLTNRTGVTKGDSAPFNPALLGRFNAGSATPSAGAPLGSHTTVPSNVRIKGDFVK